MQGPRPVPGYPGYLVYPDGRVRGLKGFIMSAWLSSVGYPQVRLRGPEKAKCVHIHRLVALAFLGPPPSPRHEVAHGNGDRTDPSLENLRWATRKENAADAARHGTGPQGQRNPKARITPAIAEAIRRELAAGATQAAMAKAYGLKEPAVWKIANNRTWTQCPSCSP